MRNKKNKKVKRKVNSKNINKNLLTTHYHPFIRLIKSTSIKCKDPNQLKKVYFKKVLNNNNQIYLFLKINTFIDKMQPI